MKSVLVIGMGRFGQFLSQKLSELGNEVMIIDKSEEKINELASTVSRAQIGDCTRTDVLDSIGVRNFDICFVCIGSDFQSSLEITSLLHEYGAKYVISKANKNIHAKFLLRNGADEVVYPEKNMAEKAAIKYSAENVFDLIELSDDYYICEIPAVESWIGRSIVDVNCRAKYHINILATKVGDKLLPLPGADHIFTDFEHLMVLGRRSDINKLTKRL